MPAGLSDARGFLHLARDLLACLEVQAKVIPDPDLALDRCGLPRALAARLFAPRLAVGASLEDEAPLAPVLLARRNPRDVRGVQAFFPELVGGDSIRLAPAAMQRIRVTPGAFVRIRALFSEQAERDACERLADPSAFSSIDGRPRLLLSEDARLGLAYLGWFEPLAMGCLGIPENPYDAWPEGLGIERAARDGGVWSPGRWNELGQETLRALLRWQIEQGRGLRGVYGSTEEALETLHRGDVSPHALVLVRFGRVWFATTPGQLAVAQALGVPAQEMGELSEFFERKLLSLADVLASRGADLTAASARLERLGLEAVTRSGYSLCSETFRAPPSRARVVKELFERITLVEDDYREGLTTDEERYNKVVDLWSDARDRCSYPDPHPDRSERSFVLLYRAGLADRSKIQKIHTMLGLFSKPNEEIVEVGCERSWLDGLRPHDYFKSSTASRHGRIMALRQRWQRASMWGVLVRSLGAVKIVEDDCGTVGSLPVEALKMDAWEEILSLQERLRGRSLVEVPDSHGQGARVRSPLACEAEGGVCVLCHGAGPGRRGLPAVGDAVGLWAADAVGSRAHRFASRTFHIGGGDARWPRRNFPGGALELQRFLCLRRLDADRSAAAQVRLLPRGEVGAWLVDEVQLFFAFQGMFLAPVHAELIAAQMLDFLRVTEPGDAPWAAGTKVRRSVFFRTNNALIREGKRPACAEPTAVGLGRIWLAQGQIWMHSTKLEQSVTELLDRQVWVALGAALQSSSQKVELMH